MSETERAAGWGVPVPTFLGQVENDHEQVPKRWDWTPCPCSGTPAWRRVDRPKKLSESRQRKSCGCVTPPELARSLITDLLFLVLLTQRMFPCFKFPGQGRLCFGSGERAGSSVINWMLLHSISAAIARSTSLLDKSCVNVLLARNGSFQKRVLLYHNKQAHRASDRSSAVTGRARFQFVVSKVSLYNCSCGVQPHLCFSRTVNVTNICPKSV